MALNFMQMHKEPEKYNYFQRFIDTDNKTSKSLKKRRSKSDMKILDKNFNIKDF